MKRTAALGEAGVNPDEPAYPYGLRINLGADEIKKLMLGKDLQVGDEMILQGKVEVVGVNAGEMKDGKDDLRVELQITEMYLEDEKEQKPDSAKFYGE